MLVWCAGQVYNLKQAKRDIASIYATGLFEDVNITPKESDSSTESSPQVRASGHMGRAFGRVFVRAFVRLCVRLSVRMCEQAEPVWLAVCGGLVRGRGGLRGGQWVRML